MISRNGELRAARKSTVVSLQVRTDSQRPSPSLPAAVLRGTALQVLGRFWGAGCTVAILWLAARELEVEAFGRFTFYLALFAWLDSLANMGTGEVAVQRTAAHPGEMESVLGGARRIRMAAGLTGVALTAAVALVYGERDTWLLVLAALYPVTHVLELSSTVFRNRIAWGVPVAMRAGASALSLTFVALLASNDVSRPALYLCGVAAGSATANVMLHLTSLRHIPRTGAAPTPWRELWSEAWPLGVSALFAQTYFYVDNVFIRELRGEEELGPYNIAVRVLSYCIMIAQYASLTLLPWLRRRHLEHQLGAALGQIGPPLFALAGVGAGLLFPWTRELLELFRPGFGVAAASLRWLLLATVAIYAGSTLLTAVVALGLNRQRLWISAGGLALNIAANFWAVPRYGIAGAGATTFATELFVAIAAAAVLARHGLALGAAWRWLLGPVLFALSAWISSLAPLG